MKYRILVAIGVFFLMLTGYMYWGNPVSYKPSLEAVKILEKGRCKKSVDSGLTWTYYVFLPDPGKAKKKGFILYPGGLVDARAYAPLMQAIAAEGYLGIIVSMPFDLAVFGYKRAGTIMGRYPEIEKWALGGHSLGGVMACRYVRTADATIAGLILWASYPSNSFRVDTIPLKALSICGTKDGLTKVSDIEASKQHLPAGTQFVEIQGGNHSQFASLSKKDFLYRGDEPAAISPARQQQEIVRATINFLKTL